MIISNGSYKLCNYGTLASVITYMQDFVVIRTIWCNIFFFIDQCWLLLYCFWLEEGIESIIFFSLFFNYSHNLISPVWCNSKDDKIDTLIPICNRMTTTIISRIIEWSLDYPVNDRVRYSTLLFIQNNQVSKKRKRKKNSLINDQQHTKKCCHKSTHVCTAVVT